MELEPKQQLEPEQQLEPKRQQGRRLVEPPRLTWAVAPPVSLVLAAQLLKGVVGLRPAPLLVRALMEEE